MTLDIYRGRKTTMQQQQQISRLPFYAPEGTSGGILKSLRPSVRLSVSPSVRYKSCLSDIS